MKKQYIIPIFVPHLGCPNDCVFCNQKSISGQKSNMTKENLEIYQEVFPKSQLRRMKVVDEYLNTFGEMIKKKVISPNCAFEALAKKYELTRAGIRVMLTKAGVYKSSQEPLYYPTAEERAAKPTYFFDMNNPNNNYYGTDNIG